VAACAGLLAAGLGALPAPATAALPAAYGAWVVEPTGLPGRAEFDLTAPLARARRDGKRLYVYLGASDCAYCRAYETFLEENAGELVPHFRGWLIVDLRSSLRVQAQALHIRAGGRSLPYAEFQHSIGDERARQLVYPSVWLFNAELLPLMQMPAGTGTFQTVPEQLEILRLEQ
jgi:thiol-disulfide isomerase/thioredoxin